MIYQIVVGYLCTYHMCLDALVHVHCNLIKVKYSQVFEYIEN